MGDAAAAAAALAGLNEGQVDTIARLLQLAAGAGGNGGNRRPHIKNIPCSSYAIGKDFSTWKTYFRDNVRATFNLRNDADDMDELCASWISTKLEPGPTRSVYENLDQTTKEDWTELDKALTAAFTDDKERLDFLSRMNAHKRTQGMSLRTYKDTLLTKMDMYQKELKGVPSEWERTALQRFREGLNNPLLSANIMMNCIGDSATLESAFQLAMSWENTLSHLGKQDSSSNGTNPLVSAMMGIPTMGGLQMASTSNDQQPECRLAHMETKIKQNEMSIAEVKAGVNQLQTSFADMSGTIAKGFQDLRNDMGMRYGTQQMGAPRSQ